MMNRKCSRIERDLMLACMLACCLGQISPRRVVAADAAWLVGEPLRHALTQNTGISWGNIPLRTALMSLAKTQRLALIVDRRIDPDQKIDFTVADVPLAEVLERIAARLGIGVAMVGPVAYFGPKPTALRLRTLAALRKEDASHMPAANRLLWTQPRPLKWDDLTAPRDLLTALAAQGKVQIVGLPQIPHDLWAAADLPPLSLPERLTLILAQFDLTYEPTADGQSIRLIAMPEKPVIERRYSVQGAPQDWATKLRQLSMLADAQINVVGDKLVVRSRQEDQDVIDELLSGRTTKRTTVNEGRKVYSLSMPAEKTIRKLLEELGSGLKLEIHVNEQAIRAAGISMDKTVRIEVKNVSVDEMLHAVLDPAGLTFERRGDAIDVKPLGK